MLSVMRNLGAVSQGLSKPGLEAMGRCAAPAAGQRVMARVALSLEGKSLAQRTVARFSLAPAGGMGKALALVPAQKPAAPHAVESAPAKPAEKPAVEIPFQLKNGQSALVRRVQPGDAKELEGFMRRAGIVHGSDEATGGWLGRYVGKPIWAACSPDHDAFVAVVDGRIVGLTTLDPEPDEMDHQKDQAFLANHQVKPSTACISWMSVQPGMQSLGIGMVLKQAQTVGAQQAGYDAVMSNTADDSIKHIVGKLGGSVQPHAVYAWTLLKVGTDGKGE